MKRLLFPNFLRLLILDCRILKAKWVQTGGPLGGAICTFATTLNGSGSKDVFAGTRGGGIYLSTDNGITWRPVNSVLSSFDIQTLAVSGVNVFAGTSEGQMLRSSDYGSTWNTACSGLPANCYFRSLEASLHKCRVILTVHESHGRMVKCLVDEEKEPGTYEVTWDAKNFPKGTYAYEIKAGGYKAVKKMLLLK